MVHLAAACDLHETEVGMGTEMDGITRYDQDRVGYNEDMVKSELVVLCIWWSAQVEGFSSLKQPLT
jgi:hypothetical protein